MKALTSLFAEERRALSLAYLDLPRIPSHYSLPVNGEQWARLNAAHLYACDIANGRVDTNGNRSPHEK